MEFTWSIMVPFSLMATKSNDSNYHGGNGATLLLRNSTGRSNHKWGPTVMDSSLTGVSCINSIDVPVLFLQSVVGRPTTGA